MEFSERFHEAGRKFRLYGHFGISGEDYQAMGMAVPAILKKSPEETLLNLMSDTDIEDWFYDMKGEMERYSSYDYRSSAFAEKRLISLIEGIKTAIKFLKSRNRLPEPFSATEINAAVYDGDTIRAGVAEVNEWFSRSESFFWREEKKKESWLRRMFSFFWK